MVYLSITNLLLMLALGGTLGFLGGMFGIGGGIIAIPFLALVLGMEQALAQGTALAMMVPILLLGWWRYSRHHRLPLRLGLQIGVLAALTTLLVAQLATSLHPELLRRIFAGFLLLLALRLLSQGVLQTNSSVKARCSARLMPLVGVLGGACMGLLGVGGGLVATPVFTSIFAQRQTVAQSFSLALVTPCSVVALITYGNAGHVQWSVGLPMAAGGLLTVSAGVALAHRLPERTIKMAFGAMVLVTALWLLRKA